MKNAPSWASWSNGLTERLKAGAAGEVEMAQALRFPFLLMARPAQRPPPGEWRSWLFLGERGAGKTRAGAEFIRFALTYGGCGRAALVGPSLHDAREVMAAGPSGLMANTYGMLQRPRYETSRRRLLWPNGAEAHCFSAEDPDALRGPQFDVAWCDEAAAWRRGEAVWDTLMMGLRLGGAPRVLATTTPRPTALIKRLAADPGAVVTRSATRENAANLSPGFVAAMEAAYGGSSLGRQELMGELIEDLEGAYWTREMIDRSRLISSPEALDEVIVAVDPAASSGPRADACGIVAAGRKEDCAYVLADASAAGLPPADWAGRVARLARDVGAARVVAEANQGGEMIKALLEAAGCDVPVRLVHARAGKLGRAGPAALLYGQGRVFHCGRFDALEDELCSLGATEAGGGSPDRADALVWAVWALLIAPRRGGRVWGA